MRSPPAPSPDPSPPSRRGPRFRPPASGRAGVTLLEVATVLLLGLLVLSAAAPAVREHRDRAAARAAREAVVGMVAFVRAEAVSAGGARLVLDPLEDRLRVESGGRVRRSVDIAAEFGADLGPDDRGPAVLRFDPLGLGRVASRTVTVRRGGVTLALTIASYGRVRRR